MPRGGARPGAGGPRGPRRSTIERALIAQRTVERAEATGKKLAKEILEDFMFLFAGVAASYQPIKEGMPIPDGVKPDVDKFEKWAMHAVDAARMLAPYQSPTFRAVVVAPAPPTNTGQKRTRFTLTIFQDGAAQSPAPTFRAVEVIPAGT